MDLTSSPPGAGASAEETMAWYKAQYLQLEHELEEFRSSSQELEKELEKDLEAAEKKERTLKQKAEALNYEVDEWKRKYKESKSEANAAQNTLEKEITTLRDTNRTLIHRLRDIEVANDDFERQARHTTSSLEDMESRYNTSIERVVMMEEEIKIGEQEREHLRIEAQRLREELSDLKIEAEILQDKIKKQDQRHLSNISTDLSIPQTPMFDRSPGSTVSSPLVSTPPDAKIAMSTKLSMNGPPSPPMSDVSVPLPKPLRAPPAITPAAAIRPKKSRLPSTSITPKPKFSAATTPRPPNSRSVTTGSAIRNTPASRTPATQSFNTVRAPAAPKIPESTSISHLRSLTAQMQRLEARVHSVRSKLPAPVTTPPRASPRSSVSSVVSSGNITMRSRKRATTSTTASSTSTPSGGSFPKSRTVHNDTKEACIFCLQFGRPCVFEKTRDDDGTEYNGKCKNCEKEGRSGTRCVIVTGSEYDKYREIGRKRTGIRQDPALDRSFNGKHVPRLSTGVSRLSFGPLPNRGPAADTNSEMSRPSSRSSFARPSSRADGRAEMIAPPRPGSRSGMSGTRTPLGRPLSRTSFGSSQHGSISYSTAELEEPEDGEFRTPSRRGTYSRYDLDASGIPAPSGIPMPGSRRPSLVGLDVSAHGRRPSYGGQLKRSPQPTTTDIGESY